MEFEQLMQKMDFLLYGSNLWRVKISHEEDGTPIIEINLHEMNRKEVLELITNILAWYRFNFILNLIHGYNHGTAIRDMIRTEIHNKRIIGMTCPRNKGLTIIEIG